MSSDVDSIKNVQDAEEKAKNLVEHANRARSEKLAEAQSEAGKLVEEAEMKAKELKEHAMKSVATELEKDRKRRMDDAERMASKIKKTGLSPAKIKQIVDLAVKQIIGA